MIPASVAAGTPSPMHITPALKRARDYLLGRQCADGGFSFYRSEYLEEPNLYDTWHALAALRLLGVQAPGEAEVFRFICGQPFPEHPYALYFRVRSLLLLERADPMQAEVREAVAALAVPVDRLAPASDFADALYHMRLVLWLKRHFALDVPAAAIAQALLAGEDANGGFGLVPNLLDTREAIAVLEQCGHGPSPRTAGFVRRLAVPGLGFGLTESSLAPSLETTCAGIDCCSRLGLAVPHAEGALRFILACQAGDGGFARAPDALPGIDLTHLALSGLDALAGPLRTSKKEKT